MADKDEKPVDLRVWSHDLVNGVGGLKQYFRREVMSRPTLVDAVKFTLRALANPRCAGSEDVLGQVTAKRHNRQQLNTVAQNDFKLTIGEAILLITEAQNEMKHGNPSRTLIQHRLEKAIGLLKITDEPAKKPA